MASETAGGPGRGGLLLWRVTEWVRRALSRFAEARGSRQAAAIAYYVLLSLFPLMLVLASIAGVVLGDDDTRANFVGALTDALPLTQAGAADIDAALRGVSDNATTVGLISLVTLAWTASGMMGAIRGSLDDIDAEFAPRPFARGKLVDLLMLLTASTLLTASAGLTVATRVPGATFAEDLLGFSGILLEVVQAIVAIVVGTGLLIVLLRWVPAHAPVVRDLWPACLGGAVVLWALSVGFAAFISEFGRYNVVYGSLAAVVVFLFFVYLVANVVLVTAAFGVEWRGVRTGRPGTEPGPGVWAEIWGFVRGLFVRNDSTPRPPRRPL